MWSRAVWLEGTKEVEDVILSKWICSKKVLWPRKEALTATKKKLSPSPDWFKFDLRKVKISSDSFDECDGYDVTTAAETTDVEEEEAQAIEKRHHRKRSSEDFLTWSAAENLLPDSPPRGVGGKRPKSAGALSRPSADCDSESHSDIRLTKFPTPPRAGGVGGKTPKSAGALSRPSADRDGESDSGGVGRKTPKSAGALSRPSADRDGESRSGGVGSKTPKSAGALSRPSADRDGESGAGGVGDTNAILKRLVFEVAKLSREVRQMRRRMDCPSVPAANPQDVVPVPELVDGPLDDLRGDLVSLLQQKTAQTYVMTLLARIGGDTIKETVKLSMNRLFTNRAMSYMSMDGRSYQKFAFRHHPLCQLIVESCLRQHPDATVLHVHRCMADYMKMAPYRLGGAGRGCHHPHFETVLDESVAGNGHNNTDADADVAEGDDDGEGTEDEDTDGECMESDDGDIESEGMEDDGPEGDDDDDVEGDE